MQITIEQFIKETQERLEPFSYMYELGNEFKQTAIGVKVKAYGDQRINLHSEVGSRTVLMHSIALNDVKEIDKDTHGSTITYRLVGHNGFVMTLI